LGDVWLETAVRSFYANQNTRIPLVAAFAQVVTFTILAYFLSKWIGLAGIPLAASIAYTLQAICLLILLKGKFPKILNMSGTFPRSVFAALIGGGMAFIIIRFLPTTPVVTTIIALLIGFLISILFIWKEIRLLFRL